MKNALITPLFAAAFLTAPGVGQNEFMIYPTRDGGSSTSFVARFQADGVIEVLQEIPAALFAGVGDDGPRSAVRGIKVWFRDENGSTREQWHAIVRRGSPSGGPDPSPAGLLLSSGPNLTPAGPAGPYSFWQGVTLVTPVEIPRSASLFFGVRLAPPAGFASWPSDGISPECAAYDPPPAIWPQIFSFGDNPRPSAPQHVWLVDPFTPAVGQPSVDVTLRVALLTDAPILNAGGTDPNTLSQLPRPSPNYGAGGLYPDIRSPNRSDGITVRVEDRARPGATVFAVFSVAQFPAPLPVLGPTNGNLWLDPILLLNVGAGALDANGVIEIPILQPGNVPLNAIGTTGHFQALVLDGARVLFTNAAGMSF